jgi:hypothetical protein
MGSLDLTNTEKIIIKSRQGGKPFSDLHGNDRYHFLDQVIARIAASTGCDLPQSDFFAKIIGEELDGVMVDFGYDKLTLSEVIFAIRLNSNHAAMKIPSEIEPIKFTGRIVNSYFLSNVLSNYMMLRAMLDRKLQNFLDGHL